MKKTIYIFIFLSLSFLIACKTSKQMKIPTTDLNQEWVVQSLNQEYIGSSQASSVHIKHNTISGLIGFGCSAYATNFKFKGSTIDVDPIITTGMECIGNRELKFVEAISGKSTLSIEEGKLIFRKKGKEVMTLILKTHQIPFLFSE